MTKTKKNNLNQPATKQDLSGLRIEVKKTEKNLRGEILKLEERVERVEGKVDGLEGKVDVVDRKLDNIQNTLDSFLGRVDNLEKDNTVGAHHVRELELRVDDHDKRIVALETPRQ